MTETTEGISTEIARSVGTIWERRCGTRAANVSAEIDVNAVRCTIEGGEASEGTDSNGYKHETSAAVARITKRTVSAYIAKRDKQTGVATQTFILDPVRIKY